MLGSFSASWAHRANSQKLDPVVVEVEQVGHPVRDGDGIVREAGVAVSPTARSP